MMMNKITLVLVGTALLLGSHFAPAAAPEAKTQNPDKAGAMVVAESAADGLKAIVHLYETKDYDKLVRERYAEIHKAKNEGEVKELIQMFIDGFGDRKMFEAQVEKLKAALKSTPAVSDKGYSPQMTETGETAVFKTDKGEVRLYKLKSGKWGFHL